MTAGDRVNSIENYFVAREDLPSQRCPPALDAMADGSMATVTGHLVVMIKENEVPAEEGADVHGHRDDHVRAHDKAPLGHGKRPLSVKPQDPTLRGPKRRILSDNFAMVQMKGGDFTDFVVLVGREGTPDVPAPSQV